MLDTNSGVFNKIGVIKGIANQFVLRYRYRIGKHYETKICSRKMLFISHYQMGFIGERLALENSRSLSLWNGLCSPLR